jgi:hypothetical protein
MTVASWLVSAGEALSGVNTSTFTKTSARSLAIYMSLLPSRSSPPFLRMCAFVHLGPLVGVSAKQKAFQIADRNQPPPTDQYGTQVTRPDSVLKGAHA